MPAMPGCRPMELPAHIQPRVTDSFQFSSPDPGRGVQPRVTYSFSSAVTTWGEATSRERPARFRLTTCPSPPPLDR